MKFATMFSSKLLLLSVLVIALGLYGPLSTNLFEVAKADSLIGFIPVGVGPKGVAFDSANGDIYVAGINPASTDTPIPQATVYTWPAVAAPTTLRALCP